MHTISYPEHQKICQSIFCSKICIASNSEVDVEVMLQRVEVACTSGSPNITRIYQLYIVASSRNVYMSNPVMLVISLTMKLLADHKESIGSVPTNMWSLSEEQMMFDCCRIFRLSVKGWCYFHCSRVMKRYRCCTFIVSRPI